MPVVQREHRTGLETMRQNDHRRVGDALFAPTEMNRLLGVVADIRRRADAA